MLCRSCQCFCVVWRFFMLLIAAPVVYIIGGFVGLFLIGSSDAAPLTASNSTLKSAEHAADLIRMIYSGHTPTAFQTWGCIAMALYVIGCVIYVVVSFNSIASQCSRSVDKAAQTDDDDDVELHVTRRAPSALSDASRYHPMAIYAPLPQGSTM